jgi:hypothetical protein
VLQRKETPQHLTLKDLLEKERFTQLRTTKKHLVDTMGSPQFHGIRSPQPERL